MVQKAYHKNSPFVCYRIICPSSSFKHKLHVSNNQNSNGQNIVLITCYEINQKYCQ